MQQRHIALAIPIKDPKAEVKFEMAQCAIIMTFFILSLLSEVTFNIWRHFCHLLILDEKNDDIEELFHKMYF